MKILLVKPYWLYPYNLGEDTYNRIWPPLALLNCAALLEKCGHNVKILDAHAQRIKPERMTNYVKGYNKIFIASSSLDRWQCPNIEINYFIETVRKIRKLTDQVYVIGYHGTVEPERILDLTGAKAVIRGEPEYTVSEICQNNNLSEIAGVSFKVNGKIKSTPQRAPFDLKNLPLPSFHLLDFKKYFYEILGRSFALFEINRGCKFSCRFCNKVMYGEGLRTKSKEQVIEEVRLAVEKYNVKTGYFIDLDFLSNSEIVQALCEYLIEKKYKFKWTCQTRPDLVNREILEKMKKAGCRLIHMGIETGLQELSDSINKQISINKVKQAVKLCKKIGIRTLIFYMFGLPGETEEDREKTLCFIKELDADFISLHKLTPYKGTDIWKDRLRLNLDLDKFIGKAYAQYYLRPTYLFRLNLPIALGGLRLFFRRMVTLR
ncbi:B12-binding domain-containing radical SAM protein [Candidatus Omnitrophota bacterium]